MQSKFIQNKVKKLHQAIEALCSDIEETRGSVEDKLSDIEDTGSARYTKLEDSLAELEELQNYLEGHMQDLTAFFEE